MNATAFVLGVSLSDARLPALGSRCQAHSRPKESPLCRRPKLRAKKDEK